MITTYDDLVKLWGLTELTRLSHLENSEDPLILRVRVEEWLQISEDEFLGLCGFNSENAPDYVKKAGKGIIPVLTRFHLLPSEANREAFDMLMSQLYGQIKLKQKDREIGNGSGELPSEESGVWIFVV